jgi:hypothetical protein
LEERTPVEIRGHVEGPFVVNGFSPRDSGTPLRYSTVAPDRAGIGQPRAKS